MNSATNSHFNESWHYGELHLSQTTEIKVLERTVKREVVSKKKFSDKGNHTLSPTSTPSEQGNVDQSKFDLSVISIPGLFKSRTIRGISVNTLNEWEGYVVEVKDDHLVAHLRDVTAGSKETDEEAIIPLSEISPDDLHRAVPGAIFNWIIGYSRSTGSTQRKESLIYFRTYVVKNNKVAEEFGQLFADFARGALTVETAAG